MDNIIVGLHLKCNLCGVKKDIAVDKKAYDDWKNGMLAQKAFPELSAEDREWIISQTCPKCWDKMFKEEEE